MRLSRTHLVPVLAIVAGGVIGASLSFGFLGSRSDDVPGVTLGLLYESSATGELAPSQTYILEQIEAVEEATRASLVPEGRPMTCIFNAAEYRVESDANQPLTCIDGAGIIRNSHPRTRP